MRKAPEIAFPFTMWPHLLIEGCLLGIFIFVLQPDGWFLGISRRWSLVVENSGMLFPLVLWLGLVFLVGEWGVRRLQILTVSIVPHRIFLFHLITFLLVTVMLHTIFVAFECVLFWVAFKSQAIDLAPVGFLRTSCRIWLEDLVVMPFLGIGELIRQLLYRKVLQDWFQTMQLRRTVKAVEEDDPR